MALTVTTGTGNPLVVTGTTTVKDDIYTSSQPVGIKFVYWYKPTSEGHLCNLIDGNDNAIIKMEAVSDNDTQMWPLFKYVDSIYCDDMDSGTLYIYLR